MSFLDGYEYRAKTLAFARKLPGYLAKGTREGVALFDSLSPGWKRARRTEIVGREERRGHSPDLVYELPGRIIIRGWDMTGAINRERR
jgi:hypothetical protein